MHTVIVGGGFAGVKAALELSKKQLGRITLISDEPYFLHHATLYATATGRETKESVVDLKDAFATHNDVEVIQDSTISLDPDRHLVIGKKGQYNYDNLVIAIGVVTTYFGIDGMAKHSYGIKTLEEVRAFKDHLHGEIIADQHMDKNYIIIGAGPTGVELAGALTQYLREIAVAHHITRAKINISLVEAAPRILPRSSPTASRIVQKQLEKMGVKVLTNHKVEALGSKFITIEGKKIPTETAIWTSGVMNHPFFSEHADYFRLAPNHRVQVDNHLQAYPDVYVLGDNAATPYTGQAWTALHDAQYIASHLERKATKQALKPYRPKKLSSNIPVSDKWAYAEKYGIYVDGRVGHVFRRLIELSGYRALLPHNQAMSAWHAHYDHEESCELCKTSHV